MRVSPDAIDNALFEALFVLELDVSGELAEELTRLGYDRRVQRFRYDGQVLTACLEAARTSLHGGLPAEAGMRKLGGAFVDGFRRTILGRVATTALSFLGPAMFLRRVPGRLQSVRSDVQVSMEKTGESSAVLVFIDPLPVGAFFAGVLERALSISGATQGQVGLVVQPGGYTLNLSW